MAENTLVWRDLYAASFAFDQPFQLILADSNMLYVEKVLRIIPKRRLVARAVWKGKRVLAKLFYHPEYGKDQMNKDAKGVRALCENKVPTPVLLYVGASNDHKINVLLFELVEDALSLDELWRKKQNSSNVFGQLKAVVIEIAMQHVLGITQKDIHLKNFLVSEKQIYTLDGGQITRSHALLGKKASLKNLALFLSQLGLGREAMQQALFRDYARVRGWSVNDSDLQKLTRLIQSWSASRWKNFSRKIWRNCTDFIMLRNWRHSGMVSREYLLPDFSQFMQRPETVFNLATTQLLKDGRSSTVIKVKLDGRDYVVKRYNMKGLFHWLRRMLRETRAKNAWRIAQKCQLFFIPTPKPVAYIDRCWLGLRGTSYYVTEFVSGCDVGKYFAQQQDVHQLEILKEKIAVLLKSILQLDINHGDLKASNIIIDEQQDPVIIDFDGAKEATSHRRLNQFWAKDRARFLRNFIGQPEWQMKFEQILGGKND